jgi:hypothetical protein
MFPWMYGMLVLLYTSYIRTIQRSLNICRSAIWCFESLVDLTFEVQIASVRRWEGGHHDNCRILNQLKFSFTNRVVRPNFIHVFIWPYYMMGTYQVETNPSVQTMETLIWTTRCWSKGGLMRGGRGDLQKCICQSSLPPLMSFAHLPSHLL